MSATILDGRALGRKLNIALKAEAAKLARPPSLAVVLVGADPASQVYVRRKGVVAERLGFTHRQIDLPADVSEAALLEVVAELGADDGVDGILVQFPVPDHIRQTAILDAIPVGKDVDGLTPASMGLLLQGRPQLVACTPKGVMALLADAGVPLEGKRAVVIGRSNIVGRQMAVLLEQANATPTIAHSRTKDVAGLCREADVVVAAVGRPKMVKGDWLKPGAAVIDVGINRLPDGRLVGDVDFDSCAPVAGFLTPVPGGVGPLTIAMLMQNTYEASVARQA